VGWYHSHPFDVDTQSKCFMSAMDVATQASYQFQLPVWYTIIYAILHLLHMHHNPFQSNEMMLMSA
jgi:proteasome lid subunit RPN8/RPN11